MKKAPIPAVIGAALLAGGVAATNVRLGQTAQPAVAPGVSSVHSAVPIPAVSGTWVYPFCCGFSPALSGPGPVVNRWRRPQVLDANGRYLPAAAASPVANAAARFAGDYTNPILKPQAAEIVKKLSDSELSGVPTTTPRNQCWPEGVPFIFANMGMQLIQQPDTITILYEHDHQVRRVRMNQPHPAQVTPSWYGDSVGRYDGDSLVIDTVGIRIGPFSMVDWYGTPYSQALHVVERYRLIDYNAMKEADERAAQENRRMPLHASGATGLGSDPDYKGKGLQLQFTVEDEAVFTVPWSATISYWRSFEEWPEHVCVESRHSTYVFRDSAVPRADKPDF